jgi:ABC-type multidrug transport system fused ATPase/permease subunit
MLSAVRLTLGFLTPTERVKYYSLVGARALTGLLDIVGIVLIGFIAAIAAAQFDPAAGDTPATIAGIQLPNVDGTGLLLLVVGVLVVFLFKAILAIVLMHAQAHFVARVESRNANLIADFLLMGSLASAKRYSKAEFQFALTGSGTYAFTGLLNNVASFIAEGFLLIVITASFFIVDPVAAVFALVYFGMIVVMIQFIIGRTLKRAGTEAVAGTIQTTNLISDTIDTFREISVLHKQQTFINRITTARRRIATSGATMTFLGGMPRYVVETALILGVVILVAQQVLTRDDGSGLVTVGVFLAGGVRLMASLLPLQSAVSNLRQNAEQAAPALDLLVQAREADHASRVAPVEPDLSAVPPVGVGLGLRMNDVSYTYPGNDIHTIKGISLDIAPGSYVAIIGPSGAGKTTIVDLVLGLIDPTLGSVTVDGISPHRVRSTNPGLIAYVPQKPGLISGTIAQNIALGVEDSDIDRGRINEVITDAYLREFIDLLPEGVDTSVGKQADALSGGQIQRIGVARALYSRPRILVLDEATSGLDAGSEAFVSATLRDLHGTTTVVVVAHRLSTVQHADTVYVVEDGQVTAAGDFATVRAEVPIVAEYVKLMSFDNTLQEESE